MGLRGTLQYYNCYISDVNYTVDDGITVDELVAALNADASTIFFDSRDANGITTKAGSMFEVVDGENLMNRGVAPDKMTFNIVAVGLDNTASGTKRARVKALKGESKNVYFVEPNEGNIIKGEEVPIMLARKLESNAKTEYTLSADYECRIEDATVPLT